MEEEIVISSWQQSDFPKDANGSFSRTIKRGSSKENIDMNAWLSEQDGKNTRSGQMRSEDDEIMLDDEKLSRLIEGDLKSDEEHESFNRSKKPKPKPRHETRFSNTENKPSNDSADKLFSDRKDKAGNLFSGAKDKADKLFSGGKDKADNLFSGGKDPVDNLFSGRKNTADKLFSGEKGKEKNDTMTSPRPVPRPRSKPKEKDHEHKSQGLNSLNETTDSNKINADKLFDSMGKSSKSVSFSDVQTSKDSSKKGSKSVEKKSSNDRHSSNERTPPKKAPRSPRNKLNSNSPSRRKSSDESDSEFQRTSEHIKRPQPQPRHHDRKFLENDSLTTGHNSGSHWAQDGMELFDSRNGGDIQHQRNFSGDVASRGDTARGLKQKKHGEAVFEGRTKEGKTPKREGSSPRQERRTPRREGSSPRRESKEHENYGFSRNGEGYSRSKHEKMHEGSFRKDRDRKGNTTDMFEDHLPASDEIVIGSEENRTNQHGRRPPGNENKGRSPMKAHKALNEMTRSPDMYNFKYESRDSPQNDTFSRSKGRSSSLTDLNSWKNTEFENYHDEDSLDSSRSGFTSSRGIRDAVYAEWLEKKQGKLKEAVRKKVEEKRKDEEEKIKGKQEKELLGKKAFEAWSSKKEGVIKTEVKKKKEIKNKELDKKREEIMKKQDAKKFFESWKSKKDEVLKESYNEKKIKVREVKQKKIDEHKEKIDIAKKAYDKWKSLKVEQLKEEAQSARQAEKLKTKYEKEAEMEKRQEREKTFQEFLQKKGTSKRAPPSPSLTQRAWCPGGLTKGTNLIPDKVQSVIAPPTLNRSRSFSGLTRTMTSFNATKRLSRGW